jgi:hypothetical protein
MHSLVLFNFRVALLITFIGSVVLFLFDPMLSHDSGAFLAGPGLETIVPPSVIGLATPILWFTHYRHGEGHQIAFLVGFSLIVLAIASYATNALGSSHYSPRELIFLCYAGGSHAAYALLNWQDLVSGLGGNAD